MASNKPPPNPEKDTPNVQMPQQPPDSRAAQHPPSFPTTQRLPVIRVQPPYPSRIVGDKNDRTRRGRIFIATNEIKPGEVIMIDRPATVYPASIASIYLFCSNCYIDLPSEPLHCPKCNLARFCSMECFRFSHAKLLCQALPSLIRYDPTLPEDHHFTSADDKWPSELLFLLCAYSLAPIFLLQFISLRTNKGFIPDRELVGSLHSQLTLVIYPNLIPPYFSPEITSYLLSNKKNHSFPWPLNPTTPRFDINELNGVYAFAIHLGCSMFNQECLPNACIFNYFCHTVRKNVKVVRALHEIEEASEISISYLALNTEYRERKLLLKDKYGFRCDCVRCEQDKKLGKLRRGIETQGRSGRGVRDAEGEVLDISGDRCPYSEFLKRHVCDCGGCLTPVPPSDKSAGQNLLECNNCGVLGKDKQAVDGDIRQDDQAVDKEVREDEQVAEDLRELISKLLPKMSEKMSKLLLKHENILVMEE